jgi:hypothetical protein
MYVGFNKMLVPLNKIASDEGVETWATDEPCPGCGQPFIGMLLADSEKSKTRSIVFDTHRLTCANCGQQFPRLVNEGYHGEMIPAGESEVRDLHVELTKLEARRAVIMNRLADISRMHIEVHHATYPPELEGDAQLFSAMTKARLMQIIEDQWAVRHMGPVRHFEHLTKADLVNTVISIKGLNGRYEKPPPREPKTGPKPKRARRSVWRE